MLPFKFVDLHVENNFSYYCMITFFHISYNLTGKWYFYIDFFQVLTCSNIYNFGLIERCYRNN